MRCLRLTTADKAGWTRECVNECTDALCRSRNLDFSCNKQAVDTVGRVAQKMYATVNALWQP